MAIDGNKIGAIDGIGAIDEHGLCCTNVLAKVILHRHCRLLLGIYMTCPPPIMAWSVRETSYKRFHGDGAALCGEERSTQMAGGVSVSSAKRAAGHCSPSMHAW